MKKPIDPNLNSFDENGFLSDIEPKKEDHSMNIVGEEPRRETNDNPDFVVKESKKSKNPSDYHAGEHRNGSEKSGSSSASHHSSHSSSSGSSHHSSHYSSSHHSSSHHSSHRSSSSKKKRRLPLAARIAIIILVLIFLAVSIIGGTFLYLRETGKNDLIVEQQNPKYEETIQYNGHTYIYDKNKVAFAFIGVDREEIGQSDKEIGSAGQADTDIIGVVDTQTGQVSVITIPRDTMVDIDLYSASGIFLRTQEMQICLSYAYGDGGESSCKNVTTAMSRILGNVPIEKYFALDLNGIAPLNDAVGGVTLTSLYDFPSDGVKKGDEITIKGDFAQTYVRRRNVDNIEASLNRTERQTQYVKAYVQQLRSAVLNDFSVITRLYNTAMDYSQTNISLNDVTYLATVILSNGVSDYNQYTLKGEMKPSSTTSEDVFAEYYVDEDAVMEVVVNCFYKQVS